MEKLGLTPTKENRKKFDIDLAYGQVREEAVYDMLQNKKIEVKSERGVWFNSGNIAIEYESWGKPSGINATESDVWWHNLCLGDKIYASIVFDVDVLKNIVSQLDKIKSVRGGDKNASKMYLLNLQRLFSTDVIKALKDGI